jgi:probable F420-dependent oxidoreductase
VPAIADQIPVGIGLPQLFAGQRVDTGSIRRFAARAEELGFSDLWTQEVFLSPGSFLDALELLAYVAALTERVRLGVSVIVLPRHSPVIAAKRLATIDHLSQGRLIAGLGVGPARDGFGRVDEPAKSRDRFQEAYDLMEALWREPRVRHEGPLWRVDEASMEPKPVQQPRPPVWFGGRHRSALRRAARLADGWMGAGSSTSEAFVEQSGALREELAALGRGDGFTISKRIYIGIDDDERRAAHRFDEYLARVYGVTGPPAEVGVIGSAGRCREALSWVVDAGAQHLALTPVFDDEEQLERLAELVGLQP